MPQDTTALVGIAVMMDSGRQFQTPVRLRRISPLPAPPAEYLIVIPPVYVPCLTLLITLFPQELVLPDIPALVGIVVLMGGWRKFRSPARFREPRQIPRASVHPVPPAEEFMTRDSALAIYPVPLITLLPQELVTNLRDIPVTASIAATTGTGRRS